VRHGESAWITVEVEINSQNAAGGAGPEIRIVLRNDIFAQCRGSYAEAFRPEIDQSTLLSVYTDSSGMVSVSGRHLYAVVMKDGQMTYADYGDHGYVERKRTLTSAELAELQAAIDSGPITQLKGTMSPDRYRLVDYHIAMMFTIARDSTRQEFTLANYGGYEGENLPAGAENLLCLVERLRASTYRWYEDCK
jgi:hypothetical protein